MIYFGFISSAGRSTFFTKLDLINISQIAGADHHHRDRRGVPADLRRDRPVGGLHLHVRPVHDALPDRLLRGARHPRRSSSPCSWAWWSAGSTGSSPSRSGCRRSSPRSAPASCCTGSCSSPRTRSRPPSPAQCRASATGSAPLPGPSSSGPSSWRSSSTGAAAHPVGAAHDRGRRQPARRAARRASTSARIKYGNFMMRAVLGAFVGIQVAFQTSVIDPSSGGYQPMFYSVAAAVIGGTAMLGGSGTIIGAFLGLDHAGRAHRRLQRHRGQRQPAATSSSACAILIAMVANVQLARLRERGRVAMTAATPDGQGTVTAPRRGRAAGRAHQQAVRRGDRAASTSTCTWSRARSSPCSATTARASPRC